MFSTLHFLSMLSPAYMKILLAPKTIPLYAWQFVCQSSSSPKYTYNASDIFKTSNSYRKLTHLFCLLGKLWVSVLCILVNWLRALHQLPKEEYCLELSHEVGSSLQNILNWIKSGLITTISNYKNSSNRLWTLPYNTLLPCRQLQDRHIYLASLEFSLVWHKLFHTTAVVPSNSL